MEVFALRLLLYKHHPYFELFYRNTGGFLLENLLLSRLFVFCVLEGVSEHENREDVFFN